MKTRKVKAFTLAEMIVVLIVASIVIAMGFSVLNMVRKQVIVIQKNYRKKQTVQLFEATLTRDFNRYNIRYDANLDQLMFKNTRDSIRYTFLDESIVREKDTFQIEVKNKKLFLDGKEVTQQTIDAIEINLTAEYGKKQLFIQQVKDAAYYMNY